MAITGFITIQAALETGLKKDTLVIGGMFDVVACAVGSEIHDTQQYSITAGTWNINAGVDDKITPSRILWNGSCNADNNRYLAIKGLYVKKQKQPYLFCGVIRPIVNYRAFKQI
jgi:L-xylulokinase